jgi:diguanylate cyclase (GGDEF)-like protein
MSRKVLKRGVQWLPAAVVLVVVLLAGARLITLSVREHAAQRRESAQLTVKESARALTAQLPRLVAQKGNASTRLASRLAGSTVLKQLAQSGYDFEVSEVDPASRFRQVLLRSQTASLSEPATAVVHARGGVLQEVPRGGHLELAIRPKAGWYPARELASAIGLLAIVTWLLTFGAHDLTHSLQRSKAAVAALKHRLGILNRRLTAEVEARRELQQSFEHARYHDAFTGLPNRRYFMDRLDRALRDVRARRRRRLAIVLIDIERFRLINDSLGQTAGDELMVQAARRFEHATAGLESVLARWSDDQFAALVLDIPSADAAFEIAHMLQESLHEPFELRKHRLGIAARMGVTCVESGLQRAEEALREADVALSVARREEETRTVAYSPAMGGDAASLVSLEADLHVALERNEFKLMFQPIVSLPGKRIVGVEVLLRWQHPLEGLLPPARFLPAAEEAGVIVPLTYWIIERVCRLAGEWRRRLPPGTSFYFSINLSAAALRDPGFVEFVARTLTETRMPATALKFELTEGGLISNVGAAREVLDRLHRLGLELMLDDFGTGYSSLSYLQLFPFDYLKIDRPFIANGAQGAQPGNGITCAVLQMAASLGLKSVAETVETPGVAHSLAEMGCDYGQGHFFSEPLEAEEALKRLRAQGVALPATVAALDETIIEKEDDSPTIILPADWVTEEELEAHAAPRLGRV